MTPIHRTTTRTIFDHRTINAGWLGYMFDVKITECVVIVPDGWVIFGDRVLIEHCRLVVFDPTQN